VAQNTYVAPVIATSTTTWAQFKTGGAKIILDNLITANAAIAEPTVAATTAETVATGGLAAGTYYVAYVWRDAYGSTTIGASESAAITVTNTSHLTTVTIPAKPTRCQSADILLTPLGGASGSETLYATGVTTTTFALTYAPPADQSTAAVPAVNTTGAAAHTTRIYSLQCLATSEKVLTRLTEDVSNILSGYPIDVSSVYAQMMSWDGILATWRQVMKEVNTLVVANYPSATVATGVTAIGMPVRGWTLP
jgi:hypothetical protein